MKKTCELLSLLLLLMMFEGLSYGSQIDQAGPLRALRKAKMRGESTVDGEQWAVSSSGGEGSLNNIVGGDIKNDVIQGGLPGQPSSGVKFKQYAGYVTVNEANGRSLFYYFAEATHDPSSKPLLLWLNGGPGCSSFGVGAMVEIGPFGVNSDGKSLYLRRHAWNRVANTLFLESPAGVGFSYSNTTSDYHASGDKRTAQDAYTFLINWFKRYPHYKKRDLYIMGESYSGFYIPELADTIIHKNMQEDSSSAIQLKGIMIGNGIMNDVTDRRGIYDYVWSHALISDETHQGLIEHCGKSISPECDYFEEKVGLEAGNIDYYNIYIPTCLSSSNSSIKPKRQGGFDPCEEDYVYNYLNLPQVQEALHANKTKLPYPWQFCSPLITSWRDSPSTMFPIYRRLISAGLPILLFSGDVDAVVPVCSTRYSIDAMNLTVIKPWHPWSDETKEVAGYQVVYKGLTFATIRGAGHEAPRFQPRRALALVKSFMAVKSSI
ncbi:hypothetical protein HHK36_009969 [Tetracentron sinense]|uniref:Carboxypeptidase n=1 Tax=Tetracentron sinense TaxID=13715 RepID=A0A834ZDP7_TETSI|nr:hypothetical protein HHK36_009969 [Tetracentron sinense]